MFAPSQAAHRAWRQRPPARRRRPQQLRAAMHALRRRSPSRRRRHRARAADHSLRQAPPPEAWHSLRHPAWLRRCNGVHAAWRCRHSHGGLGRAQRGIIARVAHIQRTTPAAAARRTHSSAAAVVGSPCATQCPQRQRGHSHCGGVCKNRRGVVQLASGSTAAAARTQEALPRQAMTCRPRGSCGEEPRASCLHWLNRAGGGGVERRSARRRRPPPPYAAAYASEQRRRPHASSDRTSADCIDRPPTDATWHLYLDYVTVTCVLRPAWSLLESHSRSGLVNRALSPPPQRAAAQPHVRRVEAHEWHARPHDHQREGKGEAEL